MKVKHILHLNSLKWKHNMISSTVILFWFFSLLQYLPVLVSLLQGKHYLPHKGIERTVFLRGMGKKSSGLSSRTAKCSHQDYIDVCSIPILKDMGWDFVFLSPPNPCPVVPFFFLQLDLLCLPAVLQILTCPSKSTWRLSCCCLSRCLALLGPPNVLLLPVPCATVLQAKLLLCCLCSSLESFL